MSNIYAVVIDSIVVNIIIWDGVEPLDLGEDIINTLGNPVDIGWGYANNKFSPIELKDGSSQELP